MSNIIQTPYGPKTPELLCKAMDAYELQPELLETLNTLVNHVLHYAAMPHASSSAARDAAQARAVIAKAEGK